MFVDDTIEHAGRSCGQLIHEHCGTLSFLCGHLRIALANYDVHKKQTQLLFISEVQRKPNYCF